MKIPEDTRENQATKKKGLPNNGQPPDKALKIKMNRINIPDSVSS